MPTKRGRSTEDVESDIEALITKIKDVEEIIEKTEEKADKTNAELGDVQSRLGVSTSDKEKDDLLKQEQRLSEALKRLSSRETQRRTELKQLREKAKQLREEKAQLKAELLVSAPSALHEGATAMIAQLRSLEPHMLAAGEVITFPEGLLLHPDYSRLYVRGCYGPLFTKVQAAYRKVVITGTPGTGKSWFMYYMMAQLLRLPEPPPYILWQHLARPDKLWCYDRDSQEVKLGTLSSFDKQLDTSQAWYICDGMQPMFTVRARVILITSPCHETYKEMVKADAVMVYMPLWKQDELMSCRAKVYDDTVPEDLAEQLYFRFGGVARYVLGKPSKQEGMPSTAARLGAFEQVLAAAIDKCNVAQVTKGIGFLASGPEASHHGLHIIANDDFSMSHLDFASRWVADQFVVSRSMKEDIGQLAALVNGTAGSLRGHLHEQLMHRLLPQGGACTVVGLDRDTLTRAGMEEQLQLPKSTESCSFKDLREVMSGGGLPLLKDGAYCRPLLSNFATVDSLLRVGKTLHLFQMTVSSSGKGVSAKALTSLFKMLGDDSALNQHYEELCLYYVVPPDIFDSFKLRKISSEWPPNGQDQPHAARAQLYVLKGGPPPAVSMPQQ